MTERRAQRTTASGTTDTKPKSPPKKVAKAPSTAKADRASGEAASRRIDERIRSLGDWRGETLAQVRRLIHEADPDITEEWKWMGTPVWSHGGNVCTGETYKQVVKLTFAQGASLKDPRRLFNSSLEGNTRRAIDIREGEAIDAKAFQALIQAAVGLNILTSNSKSKSPSKSGAMAKPRAKVFKPDKAGKGEEVVLLSGGNPQIAKADGDAPVQAYIAAMSGWKSDFGKRLDSLIVRAVPKVSKAVKWNSPFYGIEGRGWFLSFHVFTRYVKVTFFSGTSLRPIPPGGSERSKEVRWIDVYDEGFDEAQMAKWVKQAAALPGCMP